MTDRTRPRFHIAPRWRWTALAAAGVALLIGANAHLLYVAVKSQPDCVPHLKSPNDSGTTFRAAKSAC